MKKSTKAPAARAGKSGAGTPMDASIQEASVGTAATNHRRTCWAIKTLVAEFITLFPETTFEFSNYDGRNTALDVTFDLTGLIEDDRDVAVALLRLLKGTDVRVADVVTEDDAVLVSIQHGPRTQDSRDPFGLDDAYMVMVEENEGEPDGVMDPTFYADMATVGLAPEEGSA